MAQYSECSFSSNDPYKNLSPQLSGQNIIGKGTRLSRYYDSKIMTHKRKFLDKLIKSYVAYDYLTNGLLLASENSNQVKTYTSKSKERNGSANMTNLSGKTEIRSSLITKPCSCHNYHSCRSTSKMRKNTNRFPGHQHCMYSQNYEKSNKTRLKRFGSKMPGICSSSKNVHSELCLPGTCMILKRHLSNDLMINPYINISSLRPKPRFRRKPFEPDTKIQIRPKPNNGILPGNNFSTQHESQKNIADKTQTKHLVGESPYIGRANLGKFHFHDKKYVSVPNKSDLCKGRKTMRPRCRQTTNQDKRLFHATNVFKEPVSVVSLHEIPMDNMIFNKKSNMQNENVKLSTVHKYDDRISGHSKSTSSFIRRYFSTCNYLNTEKSVRTTDAKLLTNSNFDTIKNSRRKPTYVLYVLDGSNFLSCNNNLHKGHILAPYERKIPNIKEHSRKMKPFRETNARLCGDPKLYYRLKAPEKLSISLGLKTNENKIYVDSTMKQYPHTSDTFNKKETNTKLKKNSSTNAKSHSESLELNHKCSKIIKNESHTTHQHLSMSQCMSDIYISTTCDSNCCFENKKIGTNRKNSNKYVPTRKETRNAKITNTSTAFKSKSSQCGIKTFKKRQQTKFSCIPLLQTRWSQSNFSLSTGYCKHISISNIRNKTNTRKHRWDNYLTSPKKRTENCTKPCIRKGIKHQENRFRCVQKSQVCLPKTKIAGSNTKIKTRKHKYVQTDNCNKLKVFLDSKRFICLGSNTKNSRSINPSDQTSTFYNTPLYCAQNLRPARPLKCYNKKHKHKSAFTLIENITTDEYKSEIRSTSRAKQCKSNTLVSQRTDSAIIAHNYDVYRKKNKSRFVKNKYGIKFICGDVRSPFRKLLSKSSHSNKNLKVPNVRTHHGANISRSHTVCKVPTELENFRICPGSNYVYSIGSNINLSIQFHKEDSSDLAPEAISDKKGTFVSRFTSPCSNGSQDANSTCKKNKCILKNKKKPKNTAWSAQFNESKTYQSIGTSYEAITQKLETKGNNIPKCKYLENKNCPSQNNNYRSKPSSGVPRLLFAQNILKPVTKRTRSNHKVPEAKIISPQSINKKSKSHLSDNNHVHGKEATGRKSQCEFTAEQSDISHEIDILSKICVLDDKPTIKKGFTANNTTSETVHKDPKHLHEHPGKKSKYKLLKKLAYKFQKKKHECLCDNSVSDNKTHLANGIHKYKQEKCFSNEQQNVDQPLLPQKIGSQELTFQKVTKYKYDKRQLLDLDNKNQKKDCSYNYRKLIKQQLLPQQLQGKSTQVNFSTLLVESGVSYDKSTFTAEKEIEQNISECKLQPKRVLNPKACFKEFKSKDKLLQSISPKAKKDVNTKPRSINPTVQNTSNVKIGSCIFKNIEKPENNSIKNITNSPLHDLNKILSEKLVNMIPSEKKKTQLKRENNISERFAKFSLVNARKDSKMALKLKQMKRNKDVCNKNDDEKSPKASLMLKQALLTEKYENVETLMPFTNRIFSKNSIRDKNKKEKQQNDTICVISSYQDKQKYEKKTKSNSLRHVNTVEKLNYYNGSNYQDNLESLRYQHSPSHLRPLNTPGISKCKNFNAIITKFLRNTFSYLGLTKGDKGNKLEKTNICEIPLAGRYKQLKVEDGELNTAQTVAEKHTCHIMHRKNKYSKSTHPYISSHYRQINYNELNIQPKIEKKPKCQNVKTQDTCSKSTQSRCLYTPQTFAKQCNCKTINGQVMFSKSKQPWLLCGHGRQIKAKDKEVNTQQSFKERHKSEKVNRQRIYSKSKQPRLISGLYKQMNIKEKELSAKQAPSVTRCNYRGPQRDFDKLGYFEIPDKQNNISTYKSNCNKTLTKNNARETNLKNKKRTQTSCAICQNSGISSADVKQSVCKNMKIFHSHPTCHRDHTEFEISTSRPESVPGFCKSLHKKKSKSTLQKQGCSMCLRNSFFAVPPAEGNSQQKRIKTVAKTEKHKKVKPASQNKSDKKSSPLDIVVDANSMKVIEVPPADFSTQDRRIKSVGKTEKQNKVVTVSQDVSDKTSALLDIIVDVETMKVTNEAEVRRKLKSFGYKKNGPLESPGEQSSQSPGFELVLNKNNASILNEENMLQALGKSKRNPKLDVISKTDSFTKSHLCCPIKEKLSPNVISVKPQSHSKHCTCCICTNDPNRKNRSHPKNCTCCICRRYCRYGTKIIENKSHKSKPIKKNIETNIEPPPCLKAVKEEQEKGGGKVNRKEIIKKTASGIHSLVDNVKTVSKEISGVAAHIESLIYDLRVKPCSCGNKICINETKKLDKLHRSHLKINVPPECVCGSKVCKLRHTKKTPYYQEKSKKETRKAIQNKERKQRLRKETIAILKRYSKEDASIRKKIRRQDKKAMNNLKKYRDGTNSFILLAENAADVGRFGINTVRRMITHLHRYIRHPRAFKYRLKVATAHPGRTTAKALQEFRDSGYSGTIARVKHRCKSMQTSKYVISGMQKHPVTNYLLHFRDKHHNRRFRPVKKTSDYECNFFLSTLRTKPCLWLYRVWPWFYPHCLSLLVCWRHFTDAVLVLLAVAVWCPCIILMELCRTIMFCLMCSGPG